MKIYKVWSTGILDSMNEPLEILGYYTDREKAEKAKPVFTEYQKYMHPSLKAGIDEIEVDDGT